MMLVGRRMFSRQLRGMSSSIHLDSGFCMLPRPEKWQKGGEDAFFISENKTCIGVADGVGASSTSGEFSRTLMRLCSEAEERGRSYSPLDILIEATDEIKDLHLGGSCTALVACLIGDRTATLEISNLGDSGIKIFRHGLSTPQRKNIFAISPTDEDKTVIHPEKGHETVFRTKEQQHHFNCPFQVDGAREHSFCDSPQSSNQYKFRVEHGDIVVAATDGLWDNLFEYDVLHIIEQAFKSYSGDEDFPTRLAVELGTTALRVGSNPHCTTPFSLKATATSSRLNYKGGKLDDICVVVSIVKFH